MDSSADAADAALAKRLEQWAETAKQSGSPKLAEDLHKAAERITALEHALLFYADPATYFAIGFLPDPPYGEFMNDFSDTEELGLKPGKMARAVLGLEEPKRLSIDY